MYPVGKNNAIAKQAWATKLSEAWYPTTFMDKYGITGRPVQFHGHIIFRPPSDPNHEINSHVRNRVCSKEESYSCRCSTTLNIGSKTINMCARTKKTELQEMTCNFEELPHPIFYCADPFLKGDLKSKKGKQTINIHSILACNQFCIYAAVLCLV